MKNIDLKEMAPFGDMLNEQLLTLPALAGLPRLRFQYTASDLTSERGDILGIQMSVAEQLEEETKSLRSELAASSQRAEDSKETEEQLQARIQRLSEEVEKSVAAADEGKAREMQLQRRLLRKRKRLRAIERERRELEECIRKLNEAHRRMVEQFDPEHSLGEALALVEGIRQLSFPPGIKLLLRERLRRDADKVQLAKEAGAPQPPRYRSSALEYDEERWIGGGAAADVYAADLLVLAQGRFGPPPGKEGPGEGEGEAEGPPMRIQVAFKKLRRTKKRPSHGARNRTGQQSPRRQSPAPARPAAALDPLIKESQIWWQVSGHPNVVRLHGVCLDGPRRGLVMDLCDHDLDGGRAWTLDTWLYEWQPQAASAEERVLEPADALPAKCNLAVIDQLVDLIAHLHSHRVAHRDIKSANLKVRTDQMGTDKFRFQIKLGDFGSAKVLKTMSVCTKTKGAHQTLGTMRWSAPEALDGSIDKVNGMKLDVFSAGCVIGEVLLRLPPYLYCCTDTHVMAALYQKRGPFECAAVCEALPHRGQQVRALSPPLRRLLASCCQHDFKQRTSAAVIKEKLWPAVLRSICAGPGGAAAKPGKSLEAQLKASKQSAAALREQHARAVGELRAELGGLRKAAAEHARAEEAATALAQKYWRSLSETQAELGAQGALMQRRAEQAKAAHEAKEAELRRVRETADERERALRSAEADHARQLAELQSAHAAATAAASEAQESAARHLAELLSAHAAATAAASEAQESAARLAELQSAHAAATAAARKAREQNTRLQRQVAAGLRREEKAAARLEVFESQLRRAAEARIRASLAEFKQADSNHRRGGGVDPKLATAFNQKKAAVAAVAREVAGMVGLDGALLAQARAVAETPDAVVVRLVWDASRKGSKITVQEGGAKAARTSGDNNWSNCGVVGSAGWSRGTHSWSVEAYTPELFFGRFSGSVVGVATGKLTGSELRGDSCCHVKGKTFGHQLYGGHTKYSLGKVSGSDFQVRKQRVTLRLTLDGDAHTLEVVDDGGQSLKIKLPAGETFFPYAAQAIKGQWVKFVSN